MKEFTKILNFARPYAKSITFAFVCLLLTSMISLLLPLIVRNMINAEVILKNSNILNSLTRDLVIIILLQACNYYSFKGSIPSHISSVVISPFKNETSEFLITELLNEKFLNITEI